MSTTFNFEEFDDSTREYLLEVREREGRGTPGVFAPVNASMAGCGCIMGPILIIVTLCGTLFTGIIFGEPGGVALLQTAGLLLGGWMLIAAFRVWGGKNSAKRAGTWVYGDPLFLYEAGGEEVKVTPVDDVIEAQFTHNYNNGAYQNSVVKLLMPGNSIVSAQVNNEQRAEQMVVYYNYLAWARGGDGGQRGELPPASLGGLAKYVAKNDNEPLDGEGNVNLDLIELEITEVPEEPRREGRATPNFVPYLIIVVAGLVCWFAMKTVNTPFRDDEIYKAVISPPVEPRYLRAYLVDPRNKKHRTEVLQRLGSFYETPIGHARTYAADINLKTGMIAVLEELKTADQPIVSIRVKESAAPVAGQGGGDERAKTVRTRIADKVTEEYGRIMPPVQPPLGATFKTQPPAVGHQVIAFVEAPDDSPAHFEVDYKFAPSAENPGSVRVTYTVTIRTKIEDGAVSNKTFGLTNTYAATDTTTALNALGDEVVADMVGLAARGPAKQ